MAGLKILQKPKPQTRATAPLSDYGSDFDDDTVTELLSQVPQPTHPAPEGLSQDPVVQDAPPSLQHTVVLKRPLAQSDCDPSAPCALASPSASLRGPQVEIEYAENNRSAFSPEPRAQDAATEDAAQAPEQPGDDPRAPLERFRRKKPLSVTDLVSPAWCEQQYWYSLTRFGRVRKTKAMKQGSSVHKVLEEQVHREVKIDVQTREDMFGLRIWNVIQGLRTLRATGMTREMEVWGVLDGEVVNGIIDEINTVSPDEEAEEAMLLKEEKASSAAQKNKPLEAGQKTLASFLKDSQNAHILEAHFRSAPSSSHHEETQRTLYISDIKTRQSKSLPRDGSPSKPVYMQLMLYRRLFASLAANETPAEKVFSRYNLDPHATFSDTFIAEISQLDFNFPENVSSPEDSEVRLESSQDSLSELLAHNSLASLWAFMIGEFERTVPKASPPPPPPPQSLSSPQAATSHPPISPLVVAEYRSGANGSLLGKKAFVHDDAVLDSYVSDEIRWWRGERATKGVDIEDASKCRFCEFAEGCSWREGRVEEARRKASLRGGGGRRSEV